MGVLGVDLRGHAREGVFHLRCRRHPVHQPVGDVLGGDTQGRAVLHQSNVMDVRHLRAADPLVDPAHDVAQDALGVVGQLLAHLGFGPVAAGRGERRGQQRLQRGRRLAFQHGLTVEHVHRVIVGRVQGGGGRRRHPGRVGAGRRMADLLGQHVGHLVRRGPHALADLSPAREATGEPDLNVAHLIGADPIGALHLALADHRPGLHRGVDLIASAVEKAGVDEDDTVLHRGDAGGEVSRGAALLVHDAHLDRVPREPQQVFHGIEQAVGEGDFVRSVHFRLDDVDRAGRAVDAPPEPLQVVQGAEAGDDGVQHALGSLRTIGQA